LFSPREDENGRRIFPTIVEALSICCVPFDTDTVTKSRRTHWDTELLGVCGSAERLGLAHAGFESLIHCIR
jgi:hypothetical protein